MCNNNGHCRKFDAGTMCPSYRVTRDEKHLTRGRANTLRLALSGQLGPEGLASDEVREALDLCVSCKGCKRDCPTGVDMAKMKIEFLHHDKQKNGYTLKDKLIARLPDYARRASRFAWLLNLRNRSPVLARLGEKLLGFSARRSLPAWQSQALLQRRAEHGHARGGAGRGQAGRAVRRYLQRLLRIDNARPRSRSCRPRATRSTSPPRPSRTASTCAAAAPTWPAAWWMKPGQRRGEVHGLAAALRRKGHRHRRPGAVLPADAARRDAVHGAGRSRPRRWPRQALLLEEFLARESAGRPAARTLRKKLRPLDKRVLLHGHCHQKAFAAVTPVLEVLKLIPGVQPELIETQLLRHGRQLRLRGRATTTVSMQMAELSLLPAVRKHPGRDRRRRRHQLPPPDPGRRAARSRPRGGAAGCAVVGAAPHVRAEWHEHDPCLTIRSALPADEAAWRALWRGYCDFYGAAVSEAVTDRTWKRILDPDSAIMCIVAEVDGQVYGFANCVVHENTWETQPVCYLEDLFVLPSARGRGIGRALIEWLRNAMRAEGWARLYWMTREDNEQRAQALRPVRAGRRFRALRDQAEAT